MGPQRLPVLKPSKSRIKKSTSYTVKAVGKQKWLTISSLKTSKIGQNISKKPQKTPKNHQGLSGSTFCKKITTSIQHKQHSQNDMTLNLISFLKQKTAGKKLGRIIRQKNQSISLAFRTYEVNIMEELGKENPRFRRFLNGISNPGPRKS